MAGPVRQKIDQASLERYLEQNVPEVKPPLELKQVRNVASFARMMSLTRDSSVSVNQILHTKLQTRRGSDLCLGRNLQENYCRRQHTGSIANTG